MFRLLLAFVVSLVFCDYSQAQCSLYYRYYSSLPSYKASSCQSSYQPSYSSCQPSYSSCQPSYSSCQPSYSSCQSACSACSTCGQTEYKAANKEQHVQEQEPLTSPLHYKKTTPEPEYPEYPYPTKVKVKEEEEFNFPEPPTLDDIPVPSLQLEEEEALPTLEDAARNFDIKFDGVVKSIQMIKVRFDGKELIVPSINGLVPECKLASNGRIKVAFEYKIPFSLHQEDYDKQGFILYAKRNPNINSVVVK